MQGAGWPQGGSRYCAAPAQGTWLDAPGRRAASGWQGALRSRGWRILGLLWNTPGQVRAAPRGWGSRGGAQVLPTRARGCGGCGMLSLYAEPNRSQTDRAHESLRLFETERGEPRVRSGGTSLGLSGTGAAAGPGGFSDTIRAVGGGAGISPGLLPGGWDAGTPSQVNPGPASSLASPTPWPGTRSWGDRHFWATQEQGPRLPGSGAAPCLV